MEAQAKLDIHRIWYVQLQTGANTPPSSTFLSLGNGACTGQGRSFPFPTLQPSTELDPSKLKMLFPAATAWH